MKRNFQIKLKYLISTPNISLLPLSKTTKMGLVFLFDYRLYEKFQNCRGKIVAYHWKNKNKLAQDYKKIWHVYLKVLPRLKRIFNKYHKTNFSLRFWEICIGVWLFRFISATFDRWCMAEKTCRSNKNSIFTYKEIFKKRNEFVPDDTENFISLFLSDRWNEFIFSEIFKFYGIMPTVTQKNGWGHNLNFARIQNIIKYYLKKIFYSFQNINKLNRTLFVIDDYLNQKIKKLIFPDVKSWVFPKIKSKKLKELRKICLKSQSRKKTYYNFLCKILVNNVPIIFLEEFKKSIKLIKSLKYLKTPHWIFSSNAYFYNDMFKIYAALKCEKGSKLILGQHGGFYGTAKVGGSSEFEERICDKFLTWGWKSGTRKTLQIGYFGKFSHAKYIQSKKDILLIQSTLSCYTYLPISSILNMEDSEQYTKDQIKFISALRPRIQEKIHIKGLKLSEEVKKRYKQRFPNIKIVNNKVQKIISNYKLAVVSYNGTPINELFFVNFPTVIFWSKKMWQISAEAEKVFDDLKNTRVFFYSPEEAAQHICKNYKNISDWWFSKNVQAARQGFLDKYAKNNTKIDQDILRALI